MDEAQLYKHIFDIINDCRDLDLSKDERIQKSVTLASLLLKLIQYETKGADKTRQEKLAKMMRDPHGKTFITFMTDQCFRSESLKRNADQLSFLLKKYGIPHFLPPLDRFKLFLFKHLGNLLPQIFIPLAKRHVRNEFAPVLIPENPMKQEAYLKKNRAEGIKVNLNHLGEAILGEKEAKKRLELYVNDLSSPLIDTISIKISTLYSQINLVGWEQTLDALSERLRILYREALKHPTFDNLGKPKSKFVNLDMEEYKDLDLTVALFKRLLSEPEFFALSAGIVLQSYLPDAFAQQQKLTQWAMERKKQGGAPIRLRIVKGANLSMEKVESAIKGWPQAPFTQKIEADANFKRMLDFAARREHADAVHIGVASHNLFDIAYALLLRAEKGLDNEISFEMLEGMANPMKRVIYKVSGKMLLYCPEVKEKDFHLAVAYLIRRLDENTGKDNFLRHLFALESNTEEWEEQVLFFKKGAELINSLPEERRRTQNRLLQEPMQKKPSFSNEEDTDFSLDVNRTWIRDILRKWKNITPPPIPLVIGGEEMFLNFQEGIDPSNPSKAFYKYSVADPSCVHHAFVTLKSAEEKWQKVNIEKRSELLAQVAHKLKIHRGELIGAMMKDSGKTVAECDPEISEAIDFIEYYRLNWEEITTKFTDIHFCPKGTILVAPPWNFPCSIPVGGIAAGLMGGNCVLFKPAPETILVGWILAQIFWEGGIPKEVLQFINGPDETIGNLIIQDKRLNAVVLTGATATARHLLQIRAELDLIAETGGKNAMIITSLADQDLAIKDLVQSAFGHSGQKCSACSLAILEKSVYHNPRFMEALKDATESLFVGSPWNLKTKISPLIRPPNSTLLRGLTQLEPGEQWLLTPKQIDNNPHLWSPGIKFGVTSGNFTHQNELFGPVLGLMCANDLREAIKIANDSPYGLTSGIHSLDEREQKFWIENIQAGNLYINRTTTGAIVQRQPFGGCKASSYGPGGKAGGPNYVLQLTHLNQNEPLFKNTHFSQGLPDLSWISEFSFGKEKENFLISAYQSYAYWSKILLTPKDSSHILGQENLFYHIPIEQIILRTNKEDDLYQAICVILACFFCGTALTISSDFPIIGNIPIKNSIKIESEEEFLSSVETQRVRLLHPKTLMECKAAAQKGIFLIDAPILANGRFELLHYLREVSISKDIHRYGYLPEEKNVDVV